MLMKSLSACQPARLGAADAPRVTAHFKRLSREDRTHRFWGAHVPDATVERYVQGLRFDGTSCWVCTWASP